jgi:tetratricopeptide (TPR) repeat protein
MCSGQKFSRSAHFSPNGNATVLLFLALAVLPLSKVSAQSNPPENDSRIQEIYSQAKTAEARGNLAAATAKYEALLQVAPRLGPAYNNLGALYLRQREYKKAADVLARGLKIDPKMQTASALLGISLYEMGDYTAARRNLEAALRSNPKDDNAELFLANDLIKMGELDLAATHLKQLSQRQPQNQEIWYLLGKVHMQLSEQALSKLNEIDANSVWVHEISGEIMESMKNFDGAVLEYQKAVALAPQQPGVHYLLGNAYWSIQSWDQANREFYAELTNDPNNCMAHWKLGNILLEQHLSPEEALVNINKALARCADVTQARVDRARALIRLDRHADALPDLQAAEKSSPDESSIHFLLAQTYRALGRPKEARAQMEIFTRLEESARATTAERAKQVLKNQEEKNPPN